jgi:hypothetical protein
MPQRLGFPQGHGGLRLEAHNGRGHAVPLGSNWLTFTGCGLEGLGNLPWAFPQAFQSQLSPCHT